MSKKSSRNNKAPSAAKDPVTGVGAGQAGAADTDATVAMEAIRLPEPGAEPPAVPADNDATVALSSADLAAKLAEAAAPPPAASPAASSDETATAVFDAGAIQAALAAREAATAEAAKPAPGKVELAKPEPSKPEPSKTEPAKATSSKPDAGKAAKTTPAKPAAGATTAKDVAAAASKDGEYPSTGVLGLDIVMRWSGEMHKARFYPQPTTVTIGADGEFALPEDVLGGKKLQTLVQPDSKDQFALRIDDPAMSGQLLVGDKVFALEDVRAGKTELKGPAIPLTKQTHALLSYGDFTFLLSRGAVPPPAPASLWSKENWLLLGCLAISAVVLLVPLIAGFNSAAFRDRTKLSYSEQLDETTREIIEIAQIEEPEKKEEKPEEKTEDKAEDEPGKKEEEQAEPALVPRDEPVKAEQAKIDDTLQNKTGEERKEAVEKLVAEKAAAATADIDKALAAADNLNGGTKLFADAGPDGDAQAGAGPSVVADFGSEPGSGSGGPLGRAGGPGGNGDTDKRVADGLGKQGLDGKKVITDADVKDKERQKVVRVGGGSGDTDGELPKSVVAAYMNSKAGAIKACYQKGLQSNPDLSGSIKVRFLIQPSGSIAGAKMESSSLGAESVETCIMNNIKSWKFPQAKNGGGTTVSKTWSFRST